MTPSEQELKRKLDQLRTARQQTSGAVYDHNAHERGVFEIGGFPGARGFVVYDSTGAWSRTVLVPSALSEEEIDRETDNLWKLIDDSDPLRPALSVETGANRSSSTRAKSRSRRKRLHLV